MACPERTPCKCKSVDSDVFRIQNLKKRRSEELTGPSAASAWGIKIIRIQLRKLFLDRKFQSCRSAPFLPFPDVVPPLLSMSVKYSGPLYHYIGSVLDHHTRMHRPAINTFPSGPNGRIRFEIICKIKYHAFFEDNVDMGGNTQRSGFIITCRKNNCILSCVVIDYCIDVIFRLDDIFGADKLCGEFELHCGGYERGNSMEVISLYRLARTVVFEIRRPVGILRSGLAQPCTFAGSVKTKLSVFLHRHVRGHHPVHGFPCGIEVGFIKETEPVHLGEEIDEHGSRGCLKIVFSHMRLVHHLPPQAALVLERPHHRCKPESQIKQA